MTLKDLAKYAVVGVLAGAIVAAFLLLLGKAEPPPIPYYKKCSETTDCETPKLECAKCMLCQKALGRCYYGMEESKDCQCVEQEKKACTMSDGNPGHFVCQKIGLLHTEWSKDCAKIEE